MHAYTLYTVINVWYSYMCIYYIYVWVSYIVWIIINGQQTYPKCACISLCILYTHMYTNQTRIYSLVYMLLNVFILMGYLLTLLGNVIRFSQYRNSSSLGRDVTRCRFCVLLFGHIICNPHYTSSSSSSSTLKTVGIWEKHAIILWSKQKHDFMYQKPT